MSFYTDDPLRDADNYDRWKHDLLADNPVCEVCGDTIMDKYYSDINGYDVLCPNCLENKYERRVEW